MISISLDIIIFYWLALIFVLFLVILPLLLIYLYISRSGPDLSCNDKENYFFDPCKNHFSRFPSLMNLATLDLSIIVPAYNEQDRLPIMMDEAIEFLENKQEKENGKWNYEIIIVDDGSTDETSKIGLKYTEKYGSDKIRVLTEVKNRGKGGAVRMGCLRCRGDKILLCDADGATKFSDVDKLLPLFHRGEIVDDNTKIVNGRHFSSNDNKLVVCGSRAHLEEESIAKRSILRTLLMYVFHFLVSTLCVSGIRDTQCGFKMFGRSSAVMLFYNMHIHRWAFDVDILHIAQALKIPIKEVAVTWTEIPGSKLSPLLASIQMACDLIMIRLRYSTGSWRMNHHLDIRKSD